MQLKIKKDKVNVLYIDVSKQYPGLLTLEFQNEKNRVVKKGIQEDLKAESETIKLELSINFTKVPLLSTLMYGTVVQADYFLFQEECN